MDLEGKEIKEFLEFDEITPNSTHNIITDAGRCSVGALFAAAVAYAQPYLDEAEDSATAAAQSATKAENAKTSAAALASQVSTLEGEAQTAAANAAASATAAAGSADAALSSSDCASLQAQNAANSADGAELSKNAAAQSAQTAATMADAAEGYATQAAAANTSATEKASAAASSASSAQQAAANAVAISDPEGWRTSTTASINANTAEITEREHVGKFYFGTAGGALQTTGNPMYGIVDRSYCMTLELDEDWNLNDTTALWFNLGSDGIRSSSLEYGGVWCQLRSRSNVNVLQITYGDGQNTYLNAFGNVVNVENIFGGSDNSIIPAGKYVLCICIHFGAGTSADPSKAYIYINGALKATISGYGTTKSETLNWVSGGKVGFFDIGDNHSTSSFSTFGHFDGKASRFVIFNFDMSAAGAPYSVDDYYNGKAIPVALQSSTAEKRCILASADYAFGGKVRDISGNENHLTVYGDVKGDKDEAVRQMYNAFSAAYTAENATA